MVSSTGGDVTPAGEVTAARLSSGKGVFGALPVLSLRTDAEPAEKARPMAGERVPDGGERVLDPAMAVNNRRELLLLSVRPAGERSPLAQEIFDELAIAIVEGRIRPGETLSSADLARRFGTSRTPVREALAELERQGAIVVPPRRRPYVVNATTKQIKDNYDLRACLFGLVSELIVDNCPREKLSQLWHWQTALEDAGVKGTVDDFFWHSVGFRLVEVQLAGNCELQRMVSSLGIRTLQIRHLSVSQPGRIQRSVVDHRRLLEAYEEGDKVTATTMTRTLVTSGYRFLERSGIVGPPASPDSS